jgi:two-component system, sensor histidine kinase and response regulator
MQYVKLGWLSPAALWRALLTIFRRNGSGRGVSARAQSAAPPDPVAAPPTSAQQLSLLHRQCRLLLAEDDPVNREVAVLLLRRTGLAVDIATDGRRALELAEANEYDLILMDMQMPELDGPDAARLIRALPHRQRVPIVALSADVLQEDRDRCLAAGMDDFLAKPFRPEALYSTLLRWLGAART